VTFSRSAKVDAHHMYCRVRENLKDRKHHLMFSEWLCDGDQDAVISLDKVSSLPLPYIQIKGSDR
jgi:hypothetical protein